MNLDKFSNHYIIINNIKHICKAAGILPFTIINNNIYFLLQFSNTFPKIYSDFGGKREQCDQDIIETAAREFAEETNGIFFNQSITSSLSITNSIKKSKIIISSLLSYKEPTYIYNYNGKYVIYLLQLYPINKNIFGNIENFTKINRKCEWIESSKLLDENFINTNLQYRLRKGLKNCILKLYTQLYKDQYII